MSSKSETRKTMRILLANDDGIDAPGLALLRLAAARLWSDIWVVAPERKWTAASHHLSSTAISS
jgi:5'-nucleotidase